MSTLSLEKKCVKCGSPQVEVLLRQPLTSGVEYTYKCLVCHHTWKEKRKR
ncbi:MAG: hypothetical protein ACTSWP_12660 [Candidatus Freyarchaeota archaeon]|nr:hypothetical protein [Candidatus Freyrarchaeum guaymaensis]